MEFLECIRMKHKIKSSRNVDMSDQVPVTSLAHLINLINVYPPI